MNYIKIKPNDVVKGLGVTVSLWVSGCTHYCKGCFNKETWDFNQGERFTKEISDYILGLLDKYGVKRDFSILGGEPLHPQNIDEVVALCKYIKMERPDTIIYVWTGYTYEYLLDKYTEKAFEDIDYLIDGKFEEHNKKLGLKLRGSINQRVISIQETLGNDKIVEMEGV